MTSQARAVPHSSGIAADRRDVRGARAPVGRPVDGSQSSRNDDAVSIRTARLATVRVLDWRSRQVFLDEPRAQVDVDLHERLVADAAEAVNLAGLHHENVAGTGLELLAVDIPETSAFSHDLHFVVGMSVRPRSASR